MSDKGVAAREGGADGGSGWRISSLRGGVDAGTDDKDNIAENGSRAKRAPVVFRSHSAVERENKREVWPPSIPTCPPLPNAPKHYAFRHPRYLDGCPTRTHGERERESKVRKEGGGQRAGASEQKQDRHTHTHTYPYIFTQIEKERKRELWALFRPGQELET